MKFFFASALLALTALSFSPTVSGQCVPKDLITKLTFVGAGVRENTLHKQGGKLWFTDVGVYQNNPFDLIVTANDKKNPQYPYHNIEQVWIDRNKEVPNGNGKKDGGEFGRISLQTIPNEPRSGEGNFKFCFKSKSGSPITLPKFQFTIYDLDQRQGENQQISSERERVKVNLNSDKVVGYSLASNSEIAVSCENTNESLPCQSRTVFTSTTAGTGPDNPYDPDNLTTQQIKRSLGLTYRDTQCFQLTFDHFCPYDQPEYTGNVQGCPNYSGGNFLFAGYSESITDKTTCAPNPTIPPTPHPTRSPTKRPTKSPTVTPVDAPTYPPTHHPTRSPTKSPTVTPVDAPTHPPTHHPTRSPTKAPTVDEDGFELAMRFAGQNSQFTFCSAYWTDRILLDNDDPTATKDADGKFASYVNTIATEIKGCLPGGCKVYTLPTPMTLLELFTNTPIGSKENVQFSTSQDGSGSTEALEWAEITSSRVSVPKGWYASGINYYDDESSCPSKVRFGGLFNNENRVWSVNDAIGFGAWECAGSQVSAGGAYFKNRRYPSMGTIWVKPAADQTPRDMPAQPPAAAPSTVCGDGFTSAPTFPPTLAPVQPTLAPVQPTLAPVQPTLSPTVSTGNCPIETDPDTNSTVYGEMRFCVRSSFGYRYGANNLYQEVNFIESLVRIRYNLNAGFCVSDFNVDPKERLETTVEKDTYGLQAWLCDTSTMTNHVDPIRDLPTEITKYNTVGGTDYFNQGALITVCVAPDDDAYRDGIRMSSLTDFKWKRDFFAGMGSLEVEQTAIENGAPAGNYLTYYDSNQCAGAEWCTFSSVLFADFYINTGSVAGAGSATLEFARRRLQEDDRRKLQEEDSSSSFDLNVDVIGMNDGPAVLKRAGAVSSGLSALVCVVALVPGLILFA